MPARPKDGGGFAQLPHFLAASHEPATGRARGMAPKYRKFSGIGQIFLATAHRLDYPGLFAGPLREEPRALGLRDVCCSAAGWLRERLRERVFLSSLL
jgi:hypothetical protein